MTYAQIKQKWAYNYEAGYWAVTNGTETVNGKTFGGPLIGIAMTEKSAKDICDAHNASITDEREEAAKWRSEASKTKGKV